MSFKILDLEIEEDHGEGHHHLSTCLSKEADLIRTNLKIKVDNL
jgi:hypothetical protein